MKIGIVGVSGFGGSELLRLCVAHPTFQIAYVGGESTAGQSLAQRFPALAGHPAGKLEIQSFNPNRWRGSTCCSPRCPPASRVNRWPVCRPVCVSWTWVATTALSMAGPTG